MANISITAACNRDCTYCFAGGREDRAHRRTAHMTLAVFEAALGLLGRSGIPEARILGGEPTLHPEFGRLVDMVISRGLSLVLFSGGLMPESALERIESLPESQASVLLNVPVPGPGRLLEPARIEEVCRRLGPRVMLGVTIDAPAVRLEPLLDAIERHGLHRAIRLGLAQPVSGGANAYLHPRHYPEVGRRIAAFARLARRSRVGLEFDCGWVPCMFPDGALADLGPDASSIGSRCDPVLDLLPDGRLISCYPLARLGWLPLRDDLDAERARSHFQARRSGAGPCLLSADCEGCGWMAGGMCHGGCLSAALLRRRQDRSAAAAGWRAHRGD